MRCCDLCGQGEGARTYTTEREVVQVVRRYWRVCTVCALFVDTRDRMALYNRVQHCRIATTKTVVRLVATFFQTLVPTKREPT